MPEFYADRLFNALEKADPAPGMLVVSAPHAKPPAERRQARRVLLVIQRDEVETTALYLGVPTLVSVAEVAPSWLPITVAPKVLYLGGESHRNRLRALGMPRNGVSMPGHPHVVSLAPRLVMVDPDAPVEDVAETVDRLRFFVGEETWRPGQLEEEVERGDWYVAPALPSDSIMPAGVDVWSAVMRRQPMPLPLFNSFPLNPEDT